VRVVVRARPARYAIVDEAWGAPNRRRVNDGRMRVAPSGAPENSTPRKLQLSESETGRTHT
jgi:hypothetical protein